MSAEFGTVEDWSNVPQYVKEHKERLHWSAGKFDPKRLLRFPSGKEKIKVNFESKVK